MSNSSPDTEAFFRAFDLTRQGLRDFAAREHAHLAGAIELLFGCTGKIVVAGMGKCGFIAQKLSATFNSTGTLAVCLHPAEAIHGDLGIVREGDVALLLSNSGETAEIVALAPLLKGMGLRMVALTARPASTLGKLSDAVIDTTVAREADPLDTAPTASTTLMLAVGDALAAALMERRNFSKDDYAKYHPGGSLGQRLLCTVDTLMHCDEQLPRIHQDEVVRDAIYEISSKRLGVTMVVDEHNRMLGILTDGDLRRLFERDAHPLDLPVHEVMTKNPRTAQPGMLAVDALALMEEHLITSLPVVDAAGRARGIVHLHDILRAGIS